MRLTFLGHAAFLIETAGKRLITDPYSSEIGYLSIDEAADVVTLSHDNPKWHSCLDAVTGDYQVVRGLDILQSGAQMGGIRFGSVLVYEDRLAQGPNAMVWWESEDLRVLHTGDCGILPDDATLKQCGRVDILLALAGGWPTLSLDDVMLLVEKLSPKIVIPMHFGVPGLQMQALGVEELEKRFEAHQIARHPGSTLEISASDLPLLTQLHVLQPARQMALV